MSTIQNSTIEVCEVCRGSGEVYDARFDTCVRQCRYCEGSGRICKTVVTTTSAFVPTLSPWKKVMKVIRVDAFSRETVADKLVEEGLTLTEAEALCNKLRNQRAKDSADWYEIKPESYVLWKGLAEFVEPKQEK